MGYCLTQSNRSHDVEWARERGFTFLEGTESWPGYNVRVIAGQVASLLPDEIRFKCVEILRRRAYSNAELHADLLSLYSPSVSTVRPLPKWKKFLAPAGPRSWELRSLFEEILDFAVGTDISFGLLEADVLKAIYKTNDVFASLRAATFPFFDHVSFVEAAFIPFLAPRSGFGNAPKDNRVIIAFGPGLDYFDHIMTVWHELLHFPIYRAMQKIITKNNRLFLKSSKERSEIEENIVAVLTDYLCPSPRSRPAMAYDDLIRRKVARYGHLDSRLDLENIVGDVFTEAFK